MMEKLEDSSLGVKGTSGVEHLLYVHMITYCWLRHIIAIYRECQLGRVGEYTHWGSGGD